MAINFKLNHYKMLKFVELGDDIVVSNLCLFLDPADVFNLSLTCKQLQFLLTSNEAYHQLFLSKFGRITPLNLKEYNWKTLFKLRSSKELNFFTWGSAEHGRLGYYSRDIPQNHVCSGWPGVHTPTMVPNFADYNIECVLTGGFSFQLLVNGNIFCVGADYAPARREMATPGPTVEDYSSFNLEDSFGVPSPILHRWGRSSSAFRRTPNYLRLPDSPELRRPPEQLDFPSEYMRNLPQESLFVTRMELPRAFVDKQHKIKSISSGRQHFLALDDSGTVFTWDSGNSDWKVGVALTFPGLLGKITKIFAGWNLSVCYMLSVGLVVWCSREPVTKEQFEVGTNQATANYVVIPELCLISEFIALSDCVIFLHQQGGLVRFDINASSAAAGTYELSPAYPIINFNRWLSRFNKVNDCEAVFTKLSGCYESFAVFSNHGLVLLGTKSNSVEDSTDHPIVIPELQNNGVIQVVIGDYHYMALTDSGELLSWGLELKSQGCLGLGDLSHRSDGSAVLEGHSSRVCKPERVPKPSANGKWMAAVAAGWHSGGLFVAGTE